MENITEILKSSGAQLTDEQQENIVKAVMKNYRGIAELEKKQARIAELEKKNGELAEQIKGFDGDKAKLEQLQQQVADYETAETKRKEQEKAAELDKAMLERFKPLKGAHEFYNDYTEKAVFEGFKAAANDEQNAGKSDADIYAAFIKDKDVYKHPQSVNIPAAGTQSNPNSDALEKARSVMGLQTKKE